MYDRSTSSRQVGWLVQVVLEAEVSREQVPLRNAYRHVGQKASVRINSGVEYTVPGECAMSPAFSAQCPMQGSGDGGNRKCYCFLFSLGAHSDLYPSQGHNPVI